jgi:hypothetical protein
VVPKDAKDNAKEATMERQEEIRMVRLAVWVERTRVFSWGIRRDRERKRGDVESVNDAQVS